jgi:formylglycine-generating enzyme required for sulfatase activity
MFCNNLFSVISLALFVFIGNTAFAGCPLADLTGDCFVDYEDFAEMSGQWLNGYDSNDLNEMASQWLTEGIIDMEWIYINEPNFMGEMSKYETTNAQYTEYLNSAMDANEITVYNNVVYASSDTSYSEPYLYTFSANSYSQISYSDDIFSINSRDGYSMDNHPVLMVSWYGAKAFCDYYGYRLPTEWEWQAVADYDGSYTYGCGTTIDQSKANYHDGGYANPLGLSDPPYTSPVGHYPPYGYGLCDMAGNVAEITSTFNGIINVIHLCGWDDWDALECSVSCTVGSDLDGDGNTGFRVCRLVPDDMIYIPGGEFEMGDHFEESYDDDELPVHSVYVDSFFMSKYEITNQQYCDYLNSTYPGQIKVVGGVVYASSDSGNSYPYCDTRNYHIFSQIDFSGGVFSVRTKDGRDMSDNPMVQVSWYGAAAYCNWRSSQEGYESCYNLSTWECDFTKKGYRLATEAEWEYAARGGEQSPYYRFPWGDTISHSQANYYADPCEFSYDINPTRCYHPDWDDGDWPYTSVVGSFSPNGFGLYDMAGNVWKWCNDWYDLDYYDTSPYDNPTGPASGTYRVIRGGGWDNKAYGCRVAIRNWGIPRTRGEVFGFRIVLDLN